MIYLSDLSDYEVKNYLRLCKDGIQSSFFINLPRFLKILSSVDKEWQPRIEKIESRYDGRPKYCINVIGYGQHGFAIFSNNGKVIKATDDMTEIDYIFYWNYLAKSTEDKLMIPIYKFFKDIYDDKLNILWKDYAEAINEENTASEYQINEFYRLLEARNIYLNISDYEIYQDGTYGKNVGLFEGRIVFYDSGYHLYHASKDDRINTGKAMIEFENRIVDVSEIKRYFKEKNKKLRVSS